MVLCAAMVAVARMLVLQLAEHMVVMVVVGQPRIYESTMDLRSDGSKYATAAATAGDSVRKHYAAADRLPLGCCHP